MTPASSGDERSALGKVIWFSIIEIAAGISGIALYFYFIGQFFLSLANLGLGPTATADDVLAALGPVFTGLTLAVPVVVVIGIVALAMLALAFRELKKVDPSFSTPALLVWLQIAGVILVGAGIVPLVNAIPSIIATSASVGVGGSPLAVFNAISSIFFAFILIGLGGLIAFIGLVGGEILGLWRLGSKYNELTLKLGAIFVIFPLLSAIAPILVLIGAIQARGKLPKPQ